MEEQEVEEARTNPIITPYDPQRWPLLEVSSQPCTFPLNDSDISEMERMDTILTELGDQAAGLAAVQIGYPKQIFMLRPGGVNKAFINPTIVSISKSKTKDGEACLSLPGVYARFKRPKEVTLHYYDIDGNEHTETFYHFWARAVMHEMDHLNGTLITQHLEQEALKMRSTKPFRHQQGFMYITPETKKKIRTRRAKNKLARAARKRNR